MGKAQQNEPHPNGQDYTHKDGIIYHMTKIWALPLLRIPIIEGYHSSSSYRHTGVKKTLKAIRKVCC